jgi:iron complex transport system ATP-binding protein
MSPAAISTEGLRCSIGGSLILDSATIEIPEGGFVSLIGPNGAGKTTMLKCLMKILPFESGSVRIGGEEIGSLSQKALAERAAYVPQADSRYLPFTVEEFVMTGRYPHLSPFTACSKTDREAVAKALELTGTGVFARRRMAGLSGGERQLVMIAAALAQGAGTMLLDEPAAFLDPGHEQNLLQLLGEINRDSGTTILMVTHDINRAILSSSRCIVMDRGRIEYSGSPAGVTSSGILERVYERGFEYIRHPRAGCDIILPDVSDDDS